MMAKRLMVIGVLLAFSAVMLVGTVSAASDIEIIVPPGSALEDCLDNLGPDQTPFDRFRKFPPRVVTTP